MHEAPAEQVDVRGAAPGPAQRQHAVVRVARSALRGIGIADGVEDGVRAAAGEEDEVAWLQRQPLAAGFDCTGAREHQVERYLPIGLRVVRNREGPPEQAAQVEAGLWPRELDELVQGIH